MSARLLRKTPCAPKNNLAISRIRSFSGRSLKPQSNIGPSSQRRLRTLAIETSCDDTSVAVLDVEAVGNGRDGEFWANVLFHEKVTAPSESYNGIHPLVALHSHQRTLGPLVQRAIHCMRNNSNNPSDASLVNANAPVRPHFTVEAADEHSARPGTWDRPDFVTVTRGPGMRSNLSTGIDTAKGLATAWGVPLVGVHHMQAHALTSRLCSLLKDSGGNNSPSRAEGEQVAWTAGDISPKFPFLSVLASGGHTMLISSEGLNDHRLLAESKDIAIGDCLDKAARAILPQEHLQAPYGQALERFAFSDSAPYAYSPPTKRQDELERKPTRWGWSFGPPLATSSGGEKTNLRMQYSFSGLLSSTERFMTKRLTPDGRTTLERRNTSELTIQERQEMAREVQRVAFEHVASRILLHLASLTPAQKDEVRDIVVSGGVASNSFFRHVLRSILDVRGYKHIALSFPPIELCTDNALMIAWAGMEMYDAGYTSELSIQPIRKWSMDPAAEDGGILGVGGWKHDLDFGVVR